MVNISQKYIKTEKKERKKKMIWSKKCHGRKEKKIKKIPRWFLFSSYLTININFFV